MPSLLHLVDQAATVRSLYQEFLLLLADARALKQLNTWATPGNLSWNAFGQNQSPAAVVQLNFQDYDLAPRRWGAAFALDSAGEPVLVHRGHIGGGKQGVSLTSMLRDCQADRATLLETNGTTSPCFVVGQLRSKLFTRQLAAFIEAVRRVKDAETSAGLSGIAPSLLQFDSQLFQPEQAGTSVRSSTEKMTFTHAVVVNELQQQLTKLLAAPRWSLRNDTHRDLLLLDRTRAECLFEVKSAVTSQSICTGLGQLLLYSTPIASAKLVLVLPELLPTEVTSRLSKYSVQVLTYSWVGTVPKFKDLKKFAESL